MTEIYFMEFEDYRKVEINGHSGYAEKDDIVCAVISALSQAYVFYMEDLADNQKANIESFTQMDGYLYIYSWNKSVEAMAAYELVKKGLEAISETYPDYVKIFVKK